MVSVFPMKSNNQTEYEFKRENIFDMNEWKKIQQRTRMI